MNSKANLNQRREQRMGEGEGEEQEEIRWTGAGGVEDEGGRER